MLCGLGSSDGSLLRLGMTSMAAHGAAQLAVYARRMQEPVDFIGSPTWARTRDLRINRPELDAKRCPQTHWSANIHGETREEKQPFARNERTVVPGQI